MFSPIYSKRPLYGELSQTLWGKESHSSSRKTIHRAYSVHLLPSSKATEQAKLAYIQLHEDTNKIKTEKLLNIYLKKS
ncbi:hypothetical protein PHSC3_002026 [Chlamydiales bacterium STE3]|nr:hypothetical protein PHSC3_002026 [Chlamydiales bacterium STE3]